MHIRAGKYIVVMRDNDMWIEGPFASWSELVARGDAVQFEGHDDPRWQSITLPEGFELEVRS